LRLITQAISETARETLPAIGKVKFNGTTIEAWTQKHPPVSGKVGGNACEIDVLAHRKAPVLERLRLAFQLYPWFARQTGIGRNVALKYLSNRHDVHP
tara:strand:+ start:405 stop:698 length:294 start_codon:yes stop_codon:yes gene_type:complete